MQEEVTILGLDQRARWEAEHRVGGLPSQSWTYARGLSLSGYEPRLAVIRSRGSRLLIPYFERRRAGVLDMATLPGLSGASIAGSSQGVLGLWREHALERGWVTGYLQLSIDTPLDPFPAEELVTHTAFFVFDTHTWSEQGSVSANFRHQKLYEGRRRGAELVEDRTRLAEAMVRLYPQAMQRLGAEPRFSSASLAQWIEDPDALVIGAAVAGQVEAVHLGRIAGLHAEWQFSATSEEGRSLGSWLIAQGVAKARSLGARWCNIGGGARIGDRIHQHKLRFNAEQRPLRSLRQIYRPDRYRELCESSGLAPGSGRFPAYGS